MWRLVDTIEFDMVVANETIVFRLELFRQIADEKRFRSRISRYDAFLLPISPSGQKHGDHEIQITDLYFEFPDFEADTDRAALDFVISAISQKVSRVPR